ncbi:MAG TPA: PTS sugar transporter subunit IIA, partial [Planctomycetota bacterium]|nr:PTS sugar transporter subunit IIA [Planctomycetota bacterium]
LNGIKNVIGAFGRVAHPIDFSAVDGEKVSLIFLILAPPSKNDDYLKALRKVMLAVKKPNIIRFLKGATTVKEIEDIFREVEEVAV